jgi:hypothetical protein
MKKFWDRRAGAKAPGLLGFEYRYGLISSDPGERRIRIPFQPLNCRWPTKKCSAFKSVDSNGLNQIMRVLMGSTSICWKKMFIISLFRLKKVPDLSGKSSGFEWEKFRIRVGKIPDPSGKKFRIRNAAHASAHPTVPHLPAGGEGFLLELALGARVLPLGGPVLVVHKVHPPVRLHSLLPAVRQRTCSVPDSRQVNLSFLCCGSGFSAWSGSRTVCDNCSSFAMASVTENKKGRF